MTGSTSTNAAGGGDVARLPGWLAWTGHRVFRFRDGLFPIVFGGAALAIPPALAGGSVATDLLLDAVGVTVALLGQALRVTVIGLAYIKRGGKNRRVYANDLVTEGIFAHSRNPLYVGNLMVIVGLAIIHNGPLLYAVVLPAFLFAYWTIVAAEEEFLRGKFGAAYEDYCRNVPRFLPNPRGIGDTIRGAASFDWRKVLRSEYGSTASWIATAILLANWEIVRNFGWEAARGRAETSVVAYALLGIAWGTVRFLKKSGRLESVVPNA